MLIFYIGPERDFSVERRSGEIEYHNGLIEQLNSEVRRVPMNYLKTTNKLVKINENIKNL